MIRPILLLLAYIVLSFLCFPGLDVGWLAWVAWVPLFLALGHFRKSRTVLVAAFIAELLKWTLLIVWLRHVSWFAMFGIASVFAGFQWVWYVLLRRRGDDTIADSIAGMGVWRTVGYAALWASIEWLRSHPYGISGSHLSITQWQSPVFIQVASVIGGYGLSGLILAVNLWITQIVVRSRSGYGGTCSGVVKPLGAVVVTFGIVVGFGWFRLGSSNVSDTHNAARERLQVGVVQPYMPAYRFWTYERMSQCIRDTLDESMNVSREHTVELIVWPEGALPGPIFPGSPLEREVVALVDDYLKVPLLFGNQLLEDGKNYNAVLLCEPGMGVSSQNYRKNILVPFGEYIPFRKYLKGIETVVPLPEDFYPGQTDEPIVVRLEDQTVNIRAQVCYEDCFPLQWLLADLSGVDLIFVATYNVWYGEEFGAYYHAAHSVMRAVEVGRPVLRCGSAGWSGFIDSLGRIQSVVRDEETGSIYFQGSAVLECKLGDERQTIYKCYYRVVHFLFILMGLVTVATNRRKRDSGGSRRID